MHNQKTTVECYQDCIPSFVESTMERLYQNLYCAVTPLKIYGKLQGSVSTYVVRADKIATTVLLFRQVGDRIIVLNELIRLGQQDITCFAAFAFRLFKGVNVVLFSAIETERDPMSFLYQRHNHTEDITLALPDTRQSYWQMLGRSTRSYLTRYQNKLAREVPGIEWSVIEGGDASAVAITALIELHRARMRSKKKASSNDDHRAQQLIALASDCGFLIVGTLNGKICAGTINFRVGDNFFLEVVAHDPAFDQYRLGTIACYLTVCECIDRGGHEYHFLWGRYSYKFRLLGVRRDLDNIVIYRSGFAAMMNLRTVVRTSWRGRSRQFKLWILNEASRPGGTSSRVIATALSIARRVKQLAFIVLEKAGLVRS